LEDPPLAGIDGLLAVVGGGVLMAGGLLAVFAAGVLGVGVGVLAGVDAVFDLLPLLDLVPLDDGVPALDDELAAIDEELVEAGVFVPLLFLLLELLLLDEDEDGPEAVLCEWSGAALMSPASSAPMTKDAARYFMQTFIESPVFWLPAATRAG